MLLQIKRLDAIACFRILSKLCDILVLGELSLGVPQAAL